MPSVAGERPTALLGEGSAMRAKFKGGCGLCGAEIKPSQLISIFMSKWTHEDCKAAELQRRKESFGPPVVLKPAGPDSNEVTLVGTRHWRRRNQKFMRVRNGL
jgi:hypothetical protein